MFPCPLHSDLVAGPSPGWEVCVGQRVQSVQQEPGCVERAFSHRKLLHNPLRNLLSPASVEALLFVRMNAPLVGAASPPLA